MTTSNTNAIRSFRRASRAVVRELGFFRRTCGQTDVTPAQAHLLLALRASPNQTLSALVRRLQLDKTAGSRTLKRMVNQGWLVCQADPADKRHKRYALTPQGVTQAARVDAQATAGVHAAFAALAPAARDIAMAGMALYADGLLLARHGVTLRALSAADNAPLYTLITGVLHHEFGLPRADIAARLPALADLAAHYARPGAFYVVAADDEGVLGGAGVIPAEHPGTCTLQHMYLAPRGRGRGLAPALLRRVLSDAARAGFTTCTLDTRPDMHRAVALYTRFGFKPRPRATCDAISAVCGAHYVLSPLPAWPMEREVPVP